MRLIDADAMKERIVIEHDSKENRAERDLLREWVDSQPTIGGWISVKDRLPDDQRQVLIVKELKSGIRQIGIGYCIKEYRRHDYVTGEDTVEPYWVCGGNNNIICWQELPKIPGRSDLA